jgi:hypothetical protein
VIPGPGGSDPEEEKKDSSKKNVRKNSGVAMPRGNSDLSGTANRESNSSSLITEQKMSVGSVQKRGSRGKKKGQASLTVSDSIFEKAVE